MGIYSELDNFSLEELIACFNGPPLDGDEYGMAYYSEVAILIRRRGVPGNSWLIAQLKEAGGPDEERLRALICALTFRPSRQQGIRALSPKDRNWLRRQLLHCLDDTRPYVIAEAIGGLRWMSDKSAVDRVMSFRNHPIELIRVNTLHYMSSLYPEQAFPILVEALKDQYEFVRETAADELASIGRAEAIPFLKQLLIDPDPHVRESAANAIESLEFDTGIADA